MPQASLDEVVAHLNKIRQTHGEDAYLTARLALAKQLILANDNGAVFLAQAFPDLDLDKVRRQAEAEQEAQKSTAQEGQLPEQMMLKMMKDQIPNLKTQAQFDLFMTAFNALKETLNCVFGGKPEYAVRAREALNQTLDMASKFTEAAELVEEIPEDQRSPEAKDFAAPPKQYGEADLFQDLLGELEKIESGPKLQQWYSAKREQMDRIVDPKLRDQLFDAVRARRKALAN